MENHGNFAIYFWHGMSAPGWFRLLKRNRFRISPACAPQVLTVSLLSGLNSALGAASNAVFRRRLAEFKQEKDPVFIIGHWRSGTTYLHDLLASDPEFGYPTTYECFMPNHFLLTAPLARFWFNLLLPKTRPQDNMAVGFDKPQEDEFALCNLGLNSPLLTMALPRQGPVDMRYLDLAGLTSQERQTWIDGFREFIRRVAFRQGNKRLILKSPTHTGRIKTLLELYPNARFIYIARNPMSVFPSTVHLWKSMNSTQGLQNPANDDPWMEDFVLDTFMHMFETYEQDRKLIPDGRLTEIRYEELVAEPKAALRRLYGELDLGDFSRSEAAVDAYLAATRDYQTNDYALSEEQRHRIMESWAPYFARFGYGRAAERAAA